MYKAVCVDCEHTFLIPSCDLEIVCPKCGGRVAITGLCGEGGCSND
jgi:DNA-directed RNA polymerase subunit RPC12/RpoP